MRCAQSHAAGIYIQRRRGDKIALKFARVRVVGGSPIKCMRYSVGFNLAGMARHVSRPFFLLCVRRAVLFRGYLVWKSRNRRLCGRVNRPCACRCVCELVVCSLSPCAVLLSQFFFFFGNERGAVMCVMCFLTVACASVFLDPEIGFGCCSLWQ